MIARPTGAQRGMANEPGCSMHGSHAKLCCRGQGGVAHNGDALHAVASRVWRQKRDAE